MTFKGHLGHKSSIDNISPTPTNINVVHNHSLREFNERHTRETGTITGDETGTATGTSIANLGFYEERLFFFNFRILNF